MRYHCILSEHEFLIMCYRNNQSPKTTDNFTLNRERRLKQIRRSDTMTKLNFLSLKYVNLASHGFTYSRDGI